MLRVAFVVASAALASAAMWQVIDSDIATADTGESPTRCNTLSRAVHVFSRPRWPRHLVVEIDVAVLQCCAIIARSPLVLLCCYDK